jgi:histidinol-phosphate aminotransferase
VSDGSRFVRPSLEQIPPGDPIPGLAPGVASLGLNEGLSGPFPSARAAIAAATPTLNRYPERGSARLVKALAASRGWLVTVGGRPDLMRWVNAQTCASSRDHGGAAPRPVPWPSFPSFIRDAQKRDAVPVVVPLDAAGRLDVAAVRAAVTLRTRLLFVATPNNPTGRAVRPTS